MKKISIHKGFSLAVSALTAVLIGFTGLALASTSSINHTGPDSNNVISSDTSVLCDIENNNNVLIKNNVNQKARSGDVTAGSDWDYWDPALWAENGYTHEEWLSAFSSHISQQNYQDVWENSGNMNVGNVSSGDAINKSSAGFNIAINNNGCFTPKHDNMPGSGSCTALCSPVLSSIKNQGLHGTTVFGTGTGGDMDFVDGVSNQSAGALANSPQNQSKNPGSQGPCSCDGTSAGGNSASIENTGPDSNNEITINNSLITSVTNTNTLDLAAITYQSATSGGSTVSNNTSVDNVSTGEATNDVNTSITSTIVN